MEKKIIVTIGALACLVPSSTWAQAVHTIRITAEGFEPARVEMNVGEGLLFINEDDSSHWVASNDHPTHTRYPGADIRACDSKETAVFDSCGELKKTGQIQFTLMEPGEWGFHDHLHPSLTGVVVVKGGSSGSIPSQKGSLSLSQKFLAWFWHTWYQVFPDAGAKQLDSLNIITASRSDQTLEYWMRVFGHESILTELVKDAEDPAQRPAKTAQVLTGECHQAAHFVGRMAHKLYGLSALDEGLIDIRCQFGFYHGVIESSLGNIGDDSVIQKFVASCKAEKHTPLERVFCEHVIGHGLMVYYNYDLPTVIAKCQELVPYEQGRRLCYHGAFMENIFSTFGFGVQGHTTTWIDPEKPDYPCTALGNDSSVEAMCYFNQSLIWSPLNKYNEYDAFRGCARAPREARSRCYVGLGFNMGLPMASLTDKELAQKCLNAPTETDRTNCLIGAIFMRTTHWNTFNGFKNEVLCAALQYDDLESCDEGVTSSLSWLLQIN